VYFIKIFIISIYTIFLIFTNCFPEVKKEKSDFINNQTFLISSNYNQLDKLFYKNYIKNIKEKKYSFSNIKIIEIYEKNKEYEIYNVIYQSEGLKISGLLSKPKIKKEQYPAILICHGYYPPQTYFQGQGNLIYLQNLAKLGFVVFVPDYRNYGKSDKVSNPYEPGEVYDIINAFYALQEEKYIDKNKIIMMGSSWGGGLGLKAIVKVKPALFINYYGQLGGLELNENYKIFLSRFTNNEKDIEEYFQKTSIYYHLDLINIPIYIFHGGKDTTVRPEQSIVLYNLLKKMNKQVDLKIFPEAPHAFADDYNNPSKEYLLKILEKFL